MAGKITDRLWKGSNDMNIKGNIVTLRAVDVQDMEFMRKTLNDPQMERLVVGWSFPVSATEQDRWFESVMQDQRNRRFVIETPDDGKVGIYVLSGIDWKNRTADVGIKLADVRNRKKGVGTDATMAVMRYAFDELNLNRLTVTWLEDNIASQKMHMKCGYRKEGCIRSCIYKSGQYKDLIVGGILKTEYYQMIEENKYWE